MLRWWCLASYQPELVVGVCIRTHARTSIVSVGLRATTSLGSQGRSVGRHVGFGSRFAGGIVRCSSRSSEKREEEGELGEIELGE